MDRQIQIWMVGQKEQQNYRQTDQRETNEWSDLWMKKLKSRFIDEQMN